MKTAFVTGATGFLGLNLIEQLVADDWHVTALHLPSDDLKYLLRYPVDAVAGNVMDVGSLQAVIPSGVDAVFHLAGDTSMWRKQAERQYKVNVCGTINMCRAAKEKQAACFVFTSSSSAFGYHDERLTESTQSNALTCGMNYNRTKYLSEQEVKKAAAAGLNAVILNPCNIIGPYDPGNWSQLIINASKGNLPGIPPGLGTFAHVKDIAQAHITAAQKGRSGQNYLLGGVEASFREVIGQIMKVTGRDLPLKELSPGKLRLAWYLSEVKSWFNGQEPMLTFPKYKRLIGRLTCDDSKARRELDFKTTSIAAMVADCHEWLVTEKIL